ncbi:MAG: N-acetyltransferase [Betaproteobacteria bacterium]|nr:N-acetyltransferase [Betaproteobacteria bacterium]
MAGTLDFSISPVRDADIAPVCALAREIWMQHYPGIITVKQIEYMLAQRYSPDAIRTQLQAGEAWWDKLEVRGELCGFASYERGTEARAMKLDKLYVHQLARGKGYGAALIDQVAKAARLQGMDSLTLQVNKYNHGSVAAYRRLGFEVTKTVKVDIGNGFFMDDCIMSKSLVA